VGFVTLARYGPVFVVTLQETSLADLDKLKHRITETREELDRILPLFQTHKAEEEKLNSR
jgi:hypothetical protein